MTEIEITLAQSYLRAAGHDPVAALIRSVRDLARARRLADEPGSNPDAEPANVQAAAMTAISTR